MTASRVGLVGLIAAGHSGVPRYAATLTRALDAVQPEFPELELVLLTTPDGAAAVEPARLEVRLTRRSAAQGPGRVLAEQLAAAGASRSGIDLLHFFDLTGPLLAPSAAFVATVHDAMILQGFRRYRYAYKRLLYPWALRRARACVAVSAFAKDEAVQHFGADAERIEVVHSGPGFAPEVRDTAAAPLVPEPYLLFVGNLSANKNVPFLIRAFDRVDGRARLVLAGRPGDRYGDVERALEASAARDRIELVHEASDETVDALYRRAAALVLPSRYEGFGFTPLEAMARGCPVLASDIPALEEVAGDGALLLPLDDLDAWASAMRRALADEGLRAELRRRGADNVAKYSWDETARSLCRLFARVGAS